MERSWTGSSTTSQKQVCDPSIATMSMQEKVKFDASRHEFFGKNIEEHDLGEVYDQGMDCTSPEGTQDSRDPSLSIKEKGTQVVSSSSIHDLATTFTGLNRISEPTSLRDVPRNSHHSAQSPYKTPVFVPLKHRRWPGIVKSYSSEKGFGFITPDHGGRDTFMHHSSLKTDGCINLWPGTNVEYELVISPAGKSQAINVTAPGGRLLQDIIKAGLGITSCSSNYGSQQHVIIKALVLFVLGLDLVTVVASGVI